MRVCWILWVGKIPNNIFKSVLKTHEDIQQLQKKHHKAHITPHQLQIQNVSTTQRKHARLVVPGFNRMCSCPWWNEIKRSRATLVVTVSSFHWTSSVIFKIELYLLTFIWLMFSQNDVNGLEIFQNSQRRRVIIKERSKACGSIHNWDGKQQQRAYAAGLGCEMLMRGRVYSSDAFKKITCRLPISTVVENGGLVCRSTVRK